MDHYHLGVSEEWWAWDILGCSDLSEQFQHHTDGKKKDEVHIYTQSYFEMNFRPKHTLFFFFLSFRRCSSNTYGWGMRVITASVWGNSAWKISAVSSSSQASCHEVLGYRGGRSVHVCVEGRWGQRIVILRPVRGDWDQDCKPKHYLCCSGT